jgi:pimeloyl-ACP methyl ester carboxylesterase
MSAIIIDGKIVHYEVLGRGKPIIFLHGWVGSWRYWIPAMQSASNSYRAYAIDLWGYGESAKDKNCYPLEEQANLIDQFMDAMGIGKVALVAHGLGAAAALLFAAKNALVVDRTMVISPPILEDDLQEKFGSTVPIELADRLLEQSTDTETTLSESAKIDQAAIDTSLKELTYINLMDVSRLVDTPSLVVNGNNDPVIQALNQADKSILPRMFHHIRFNQSGHFPMLDQPNKFNRLMKDFLDLPSGQSPQQLQLKEEWKRRVR